MAPMTAYADVSAISSSGMVRKILRQFEQSLSSLSDACSESASTCARHAVTMMWSARTRMLWLDRSPISRWARPDLALTHRCDMCLAYQADV
jgi:hypothetical protein